MQGIRIVQSVPGIHDRPSSLENFSEDGRGMSVEGYSGRMEECSHVYCHWVISQPEGTMKARMLKGSRKTRTNRHRQDWRCCKHRNKSLITPKHIGIGIERETE